MANGSSLPVGFVLDEPQQAGTALPEGFALDQPQNKLQPVTGEPLSPNMPSNGTGLFDRVSNIFTGADRMTQQMDLLPEIGRAPELNALSVPAFKASLGLLATGETEPLKAILTQQFGKDISFSEDEKGNVIVTMPSGQYALNKPGLSGQDLIRGVFDFAAFTPAGRAASIPTAIGKSAATEAAIEGVEAATGGEFDIKDVALAGGVGGTAKIVENIIGGAARVVKGKLPDEIIGAGQQADIPVLTSDVLPPKGFIGKTAQQTTEKIPLAGTASKRETQQTQREIAVNEVSDKYGEFSYNAIVDSLKTKKNKIKNAAGNVLQNAGNKLDEVGEISINKTQQAITDVSKELSKIGVIKSSGAIDDLKLLADTISETPQTFTTLKENRTAFREIIKGADKAERTQLTSRSKSLLQKVGMAMKADMDSFAKNNLTPSEFLKWQRANKVYADEATKLTKTKLKNILDKGDVTPEAVKSMLFSQKPSEVKALFNSLTPVGRANARSAIISNVVNNLSKRAGGISPNTFASEVGKFGIQVNQFFKGKEKQQLNGLIKVLNATRRAQEAAVSTPTGQSLTGIAALAATAADWKMTLGIGSTLGLSARIYESAPVRNALLRINSIPKGTAKYDEALKNAIQIMNASAQTAREAIKE